MSGTVIAQFVNDAIADGKVELRQIGLKTIYKESFGLLTSKFSGDKESMLAKGLLALNRCCAMAKRQCGNSCEL